MTNDIEELQSEKDYLRYAMGNISSNGVVSTSNKLLRPIELSSNEYKALLYAMAVANYGEKNNQEKEITEQTFIYLYKNDLGNLLGLDKKNSVNVAIDRIYKDLSSRVAHFVVEEPENDSKRKKKTVHSVVPIIRELRWEDSAKNALQIRFTSEVLPYFTRLANGNFTTYQLKHIFSLDSVASMSLYSFFLKNDFKYANQETYEVDMTLESLKSLIDLGGNKYDRWIDFRRYVLDKIVEEINANTDLVLHYDPIKKGRPVVGILFTVEKTLKTQDKDLVTAQPLISQKIYLDVPFDQNNTVKELGAKFDMEMRAWYIHHADEKFQQWFKIEGCLTESQANVIVNDVIFQMEFAEAGISLSDFKYEIKNKLIRNKTFVTQHRLRINEIFGAEIA